MNKIQLPQVTSVDSESLRRNVDYLAEQAMPARRDTETGAAKGGVDGDESWRIVDGDLFLYRKHGTKWYRAKMEVVK